MDISSANITISEVIPIVNSLKYDVENYQVEGAGFTGVRNELITSLNERFRRIEEETIYSTATILDPRFKNKMFSNMRFGDMAKNNLIQKLKEHAGLNNGTEMSRVTTSMLVNQPSCSSNNTHPTEGPIWAKYKQSKLDMDLEMNIEDHDEEKQILAEVESYLQQPLLENSSNIFHYWEASNFSKLQQLVPKYLGTPPGTVFSERLFSSAGIICGGKRSSMKPQNLQKFVFLNKNLPLFGKQLN